MKYLNSKFTNSNDYIHIVGLIVNPSEAFKILEIGPSIEDKI